MPAPRRDRHPPRRATPRVCRNRQTARLPPDPLQLHERPRAQDARLACISARIWSVPYTGGTASMNVHVLQHVAFEGLGSMAQWLDAAGLQTSYTRFFCR